MKVTNVVDACILFEREGTRLLTDPWIGTPTYGCWLQYPPPVTTPERLGRLDWIFISHLHEDHCDFDTIARLDPTARIVIMERAPNLLLKHLLVNGVPSERITVVPPRTRLSLAPGLELEPLEPDPAHEYSRLVDSAALVHADGKTVYFANDSEPWAGTDRYIAERYQVELAMLPFAGGSGYPACYTNLDEAQKRAEVTRIQRAYFESAGRCLRAIRARAVTPVASWHVLCGWAAELNETMSWLTSADPIVEYVRSLQGPELWLLGPGQGVDLATGARHGGAFPAFTAAERLAFARASLRGARPCHEALAPGAAIPLDRLFAHACAPFRSRAPYDFPSGFRYAFDCGEGRRYLLDAATGESSVVPDDAPLAPPYLKVTLDRRLFALLLIGALSWNIEDVTGLLRYERVPNRYVPEVHVALNYVRV